MLRYEIKGDNLPMVICYPTAGQTLITERGAMSWMSPNMQMSTEAGGLRKAVGRMLTKESIFQNKYTAQGGDGMIAFASSFPGTIIPMDIGAMGQVVVQKSGFLASESTVSLSTYFNQKIGGGLFGGEGFIMQKLSGSGTAFIEIDGDLVEYELKAGQQIVVDTGNVAGFTPGVQMDIRQVPGMKNMLFGGEGLFNTVLTGPGRIWLQTMPICNVAASIRPYIPTGNN